jgi:hypothetical protein
MSKDYRLSRNKYRMFRNAGLRRGLKASTIILNILSVIAIIVMAVGLIICALFFVFWFIFFIFFIRIEQIESYMLFGGSLTLWAGLAFVIIIILKFLIERIFSIKELVSLKNDVHTDSSAVKYLTLTKKVIFVRDIDLIFDLALLGIISLVVTFIRENIQNVANDIPTNNLETLTIVLIVLIIVFFIAKGVFNNKQFAKVKVEIDEIILEQNSKHN